MDNKMLQLILLIAALAFAEAQLQLEEDSFKFNPNIIVKFSPYVRKNDISGYYSESELIPMISKISTKFSSILAPRIGVNDTKDSLSYVATAVAHYNNEISKNASIISVNNKLPLKVFMVFETMASDWKGNQSSFDIVLDTAEKANSIHNGTVDYILLEQEGIESYNVDETLKQLLFAKNVSGSLKSWKYKFGAIFPLASTCGLGANLRQFIIPILSNLDIIIFRLNPSQQDYVVGPEETFIGFVRQFENCQKKMDSLKLKVEVAFQTSWPDSDFKGVQQNISNLVTFWKKINNWTAVECTNRIFISEAYDNPFRGNHTGTQGWWRFVGRKAHEGPTNFIYEDKIAAALGQKATPKLPKAEINLSDDGNNPNNGMGVLNIILIVILALIFISAATSAGMFFLYKKVLLKVQPQNYNELTKEEVREFFEGRNGNRRPSDSLMMVGMGANSNLDAAYNQDLELAGNEFEIIENSILGVGQFGIVCNGKVLKQSEEGIPVAVKMVKKSCPSAALKGLLSEIKVMTFLGKHENIVCLVGAYTKELKAGKVYVFTELCLSGSLEKYLREHLTDYRPSRRGSLAEEGSSSGGDRRSLCYLKLQEPSGSQVERVNYVNTNIYSEINLDPDITNTDSAESFNSEDLFRWSSQIASGMSYLSSKNVVHADLATRNVLLTSDLTAKISDFGLSRRLYDYGNYVKTAQEPLPWRWMAPESLRRFQFNEKSDVWAYGVTLWEIYSLGDTPYAGCVWDSTFASQLINGHRLQEPPFNSNGMYTIMMKCWNNDPGRRPSFSQLKNLLAQIPKPTTTA